MSLRDALIAMAPGALGAGIFALLWRVSEAKLAKAAQSAQSWEREARMALDALANSEATKQDIVRRYQEILDSVRANTNRCRDDFETLANALGPGNDVLVGHVRGILDRMSSRQPTARGRGEAEALPSPKPTKPR